MNTVRQSSENVASFDTRGKRRSDISKTRDALQPAGVHADRGLRPHASGNLSVRSAVAPMHPAMHLQQTLGNQAMLRRIHSGLDLSSIHSAYPHQPIIGNQGVTRRLQAKLKVNAPGDQYEQEADRVAEQVTRMPEARPAMPAVTATSRSVQRTCACGGTCSTCQAEQPNDKHEHLQMKSAGPNPIGGIAAPPIVQEVLRSSGQPLDPATRAFMEPRLGHDFSAVRIHTDARAVESARAVNAHAYAVGKDVVFAAGQFSPATGHGRELLAHELTHVVQQSRGGAAPDPWDTESSIERAAATASRAVMQSGGPVRVEGASALGVAREPQKEADPDLVNLQELQDVVVSEMQEFTEGKAVGIWQVAAVEGEFEGKRYVAVGHFDGKIHAEEDALNKLADKVPREKWRGGRLRMVVSKENCPQCQTDLQAVAEKYEVTIETFVPVLPNETGDLAEKDVGKSAVGRATRAGQADRITLNSDRTFAPTVGSAAKPKASSPIGTENPGDIEEAGLGFGKGAAGKFLGNIFILFTLHDIAKAHDAREREAVGKDFLEGSLTSWLLPRVGYLFGGPMAAAVLEDALLVGGSGVAGYKFGQILTELFPYTGSVERIDKAAAQAVVLAKKLGENEIISKTFPYQASLLRDEKFVGASVAGATSTLEGVGILSNLGSGPLGWAGLGIKFVWK